MIAKVNFSKILIRMKEKGISRYSLVDAKRNTKSYEDYYNGDVIRLNNSVFETIKNGKYIKWDTLIKFINVIGSLNLYDYMTLYDENGKEIIPVNKQKIKVINKPYMKNKMELRRIRNRKRRK